METFSTLKHVEEHLGQLGWTVTVLGTATLRSNFRGASGNFPLIVQLEDQWVKLMVLPIARLPTDVQKAEKLYEKLLRLNGEIMLARFSLDEDGDVLLSVEFPASDLNPSEIKDALDVLTYYADKHAGDVRAIVA